MKKLSIIFVLAVVFNCSKEDDTPPIENPSAAVLIFPDNNQECNQGVNVNATQSRVTFTWNTAENTTSYEVVLKNLDNNSTTNHMSITNQIDITLLKATPYSWYVISRSTSTNNTEQSSIWKFYNAGDGVQSHAPFPADIVTPTMGANLSGITSLALEWSGSDIDNDIVGYDVYFDTVSPPIAQFGGTQTATTVNVTVTAGNIYYWRIVSKDSQENSSQSIIFEFSVD